jgi:hypothetical protein
MKTIAIEKVRELKKRGIIPSSVSVGGNMNYAINIFDDGNVALYKLITNAPKQRWQFIQVTFRKEELTF